MLSILQEEIDRIFNFYSESDEDVPTHRIVNAKPVFSPSGKLDKEGGMHVVLSPKVGQRVQVSSVTLSCTAKLLFARQCHSARFGGPGTQATKGTAFKLSLFNEEEKQILEKGMSSRQLP